MHTSMFYCKLQCPVLGQISSVNLLILFIRDCSLFFFFLKKVVTVSIFYLTICLRYVSFNSKRQLLDCILSIAIIYIVEKEDEE